MFVVDSDQKIVLNNDQSSYCILPLLAIAVSKLQHVVRQLNNKLEISKYYCQLVTVTISGQQPERNSFSFSVNNCCFQFDAIPRDFVWRW